MAELQKIKRLLIANRGEIAERVICTASKMGITTVAVFSDADRGMPYVRHADEAVNIGPPESSQSYLNMDKIIEVAVETACDAIHPGYGFLSENHLFAKKVEEAGIIFIGPKPDTIKKMGDKLASKQAVSTYDIPLVPGTSSPVRDIDEAEQIINEIGLPVLIKASAGGGGKGMRVVNNLTDLKNDFQSAVNEAQAAFGDPSVFIEKFIQNPRHIEVQILADQHGQILHLNERECSIQRRHQKVVEESPSVIVNQDLREELGNAAINVARACDYIGAGTVEFIMDESKKFYFLEMNTRLQVEHPVTELTTGIDLVEQQIKVAEGSELNLNQEALLPRGHAIELRVYAEDPEDNFIPSIGKLVSYSEPKGQGIRVDGGYEEGIKIPIYYDPLISKLIVYGPDRETAIQNMLEAIDDYIIEGVQTTLSFGRFVMQHDNFKKGDFDTNFVAKYYTTSLMQINSELEVVAAIMTDYYMENKEKNTVPIIKSETNWRSRL